MTSGMSIVRFLEKRSSSVSLGVSESLEVEKRDNFLLSLFSESYLK